jgi:hypothetical protein
MQAFLIASFYSTICIFFGRPEEPFRLAMMAVGFQMVIEVTRHFDMAIRWSVNLETQMTSI